MNPRVKILAGLAAVGLVVALLATFSGGGAPDVAKPLRTVSASSSPAPAGASKPGTRSGYDAFRLFHTRNVFDPDRRPPRVASSDTPPPATPPPTRADFVALTGTMLNADRSLAFFSGSRAEYNKVLSVRDRIVGAEITRITPASIEIDRAGQKTQVSVGQTVPFDGGSAPGAAPAPDTFATAPSTGSTAATGSSPGGNRTTPTSPGTTSSSKQDEIRRRLEERRRQEQK